MRTKQAWNEKWQFKISKNLFPPRLAKEILEYSPILPLPEQVVGAYIWGDTETGKTIYAAQMLLNFAKNNYLSGTHQTFAFISIPQLMQKIKRTFSDKNGKGESDLLDFYQTMDVLLLDDLGRTKTSDWLLDILYLLINYRYEYQLPTLITSNHSLDELAGILGDDRIVSRILRMGEVIHVE